jgi:hypothetical protein
MTPWHLSGKCARRGYTATSAKECPDNASHKTSYELRLENYGRTALRKPFTVKLDELAGYDLMEKRFAIT